MNITDDCVISHAKLHGAANLGGDHFFFFFNHRCYSPTQLLRGFTHSVLQGKP